MSIFFKDLAKKAKDLLDNKKHYTTGKNKKFSIKTKTANGITYSAKSTIDGANLKGEVNCEIKSCDYGLTVKKLSLNNGGCLDSDFTLDKVLDNVRFTLKHKCEPFSQAEDRTCETKIGAQYDHQDFKADLVISSLKPAVDTSICYTKDGFFVGGAAGMDGTCLSSYDFGLGYSKDNTTTTFNVADMLSTFKLAFHRKHDEDITFATTLTTSRPEEGKSFCVAVEVGGSFKYDSDTTIFGKFNAPSVASTKNLTASFSLDHKLNDNASLSLTSVLDVDPFQSNFLGSAFGLALKFGA